MLLADYPTTNWRDATETMMIRVTKDGKPLWVSPDHITKVQQGSEFKGGYATGKDTTYVTMVDGSIYTVDQSADEFARLVACKRRERA